MNLNKELILEYTEKFRQMLRNYDEFYVALLIYEFLDLEPDKITDNLIKDVHEIIDDRDTVYDEDMRYNIRDLEEEKEEEQEYEKD